MKRLILFAVAGLCCLYASGQKAPKWMDKARKAVVTITTYDKENRKTGTATGFYISETGEGLSSYSIFNGASRAVVTDVDGNSQPVSCIIGANDLYDVVKFKVAVNRKVEYLPVVPDPVPAGTAYMLQYSTDKAPSYREGAIVEVSKLKDAYSYYKLSIPVDAHHINSPWILPTGQVFALSQEDASGKKQFSYGISASFASTLVYTNVDAFNTVYTKIGIRKAWPANIEDASVSLFLLASSQDAATYLETLNDFVMTFPGYDEGYINRASHYATRYSELTSSRDECLKQALSDLGTAAKVTKNKAGFLFRQAQIIHSVSIADTTITDERWSLKTAAIILQQALAIEELPAYRILEGDINYSLGNYQAAHDAYIKANVNDPSPYYMAAKSLEQIPGAQISDIISLLDSVIIKMGKPTPKVAAEYILERVDYKMQLGQYKEAIADYDLYYDLSDGRVNDRFYYFREQARSKASDNEGALEDIREAIRLNPQAAEYHAEEASILVRLQKYNDAQKSVAKALAIDSGFAACYRLEGVCYVHMNKKAEACISFSKAKELGDPLVARLIREHCQ